MELSEGEDIAASHIVDGRAFAATLRLAVAEAAAALKLSHDLVPGLAVVLVGENAASQVYVRNKQKMAVESGFASFHHPLPVDASRAEIVAKVEELNADPAVDGILVQLPLPNWEDEAAVIAAIDPQKDVDGFHAVNVGRLWSGQSTLTPCTPLGCLLLLKHLHGDLTGMRAVILGRSNIVGKPMAALLLKENCSVTIVHSHSRYIKEETKRADILIVAVGRPELVESDWIKPGATVLDVGINRITAADGSSRLVGDVAFDEAVEVAGAITPVPGGIGPMTIACLLRNTLKAACLRRGIAFPLGDQ